MNYKIALIILIASSTALLSSCVNNQESGKAVTQDESSFTISEIVTQEVTSTTISEIVTQEVTSTTTNIKNEDIVLIDGVELDINSKSLDIHTKSLDGEHSDADLDKLKKFKYLESLHINLTDEQSHYLLDIPNLKALDLVHSSIGENFASVLPQMTALEELHFSIISLNGENLDIIQKNTNLKVFSIYMYIDSIKFDISAISNLVNLEEVELHVHEVNDYSPLYSLTKLKRLVIPDTITESELQELKTALPNCEVIIITSNG